MRKDLRLMYQWVRAHLTYCLLCLSKLHMLLAQPHCSSLTPLLSACFTQQNQSTVSMFSSSNVLCLPTECQCHQQPSAQPALLLHTETALVLETELPIDSNHECNASYMLLLDPWRGGPSINNSQKIAECLKKSSILIFQLYSLSVCPATLPSWILKTSFNIKNITD